MKINTKLLCRDQDHDLCEEPQGGRVRVRVDPEVRDLGGGGGDCGDGDHGQVPGGGLPRHWGQHRSVASYMKLIL